MVEFAIALPFLMLLLLGGIELGRYAYFGILVGNAARAGVQYGAQNGVTALDVTGIQNAARADGNTSISSLTVTTSTSCQCWNGTTGTAISCTGTCGVGSDFVAYVQATVSGTVTPLFHYPLLPSALIVARTATMRVTP